MNPMKLNPIAKLRRVFTMPKMFHKGKGDSVRGTDSPSPCTSRQDSRRFSSKIKRAVSWRPRRPSRFSRCRGGSKIFRDPSPQQVNESAISADISRSGSLYVADVVSLSRPRTPVLSMSSDKATLSRSKSLPEWKTRGCDVQVLPVSGPIALRYNFWPLSPR